MDPVNVTHLGSSRAASGGNPVGRNRERLPAVLACSQARGRLPQPASPACAEGNGEGVEKCRGGAPRGVRPDRKGRETPRKRLGVPRKHARWPRRHLRLSALRSPSLVRKSERKRGNQLNDYGAAGPAK